MTEQDKNIIREAMSLIGRRKTERKAKTARENGKNGGRPRKDGKGREKAK